MHRGRAWQQAGVLDVCYMHMYDIHMYDVDTNDQESTSDYEPAASTDKSTNVPASGALPAHATLRAPRPWYCSKHRPLRAGAPSWLLLRPARGPARRCSTDSTSSSAHSYHSLPWPRAPTPPSSSSSLTRALQPLTPRQPFARPWCLFSPPHRRPSTSYYWEARKGGAERGRGEGGRANG